MVSVMNTEEKTVYEYLKSEGFKLIQPEPDGKVPPDFSIDNNIAIEVRRLNENYFVGSKPIGYREEFYKIWDLLSHFLDDYKNPNLTTSYWLSYGFERPIPDFSNLKKNLKISLDCFINNPIHNDEIQVTPSFTIRLYPKQTEEKHSIVVASSHDDNGGGAVTQIYISNINYCIKEKTLKIDAFKSKYSEWWLILVDTLVYRVLSNAMEHVKTNIELSDVWDKLIILDPESKKPTLVISK